MKKLLSAVLLCAGIFLAFSASAASENDGLILHLKLDEGTGTIAKDSSGKGHDAKLVNPLWEEFGVRGKAVRLNGKDAYIELPLHPDFDCREQITMSLWFKAEKFYAGESLFNRGNYVLAWSTYIFRSGISFSSRKMGGIFYRIDIPQGTGPLISYTNIVFTIAPDPTNAGQSLLRTYMNGKLLSQKGVRDIALKSQIAVHQKCPVTIGRFASAEAQWFKGIVDEVKIYNRALSEKEIAAEYKKLSAQAVNVPVKKTVLKKVNFAPLKNTRIAIFKTDVTDNKKTLPGPARKPVNWTERNVTGKGAPVPVRPIEWFKAQAEKNLCKVQVIGDKALCDGKFLTKKNFDTLIIPYGMIPLEAEDSVYHFLAGGGNVIQVTPTPASYWYKEDGSLFSKNHSYGWFAPFLVRVNPSPSARRKCVNALALNPAVTGLTGDLLPASFGPFPRMRYSPLDQWNKQADLEGSYGDPFNFAQGADLKVDLYQEITGIGGDFVVYRYYNNLIFGATFVNLGSVGSKLIKGNDGDKVFKAALYLLESRLPGEQPLAYYQNTTKLHKAWSDFNFTYLEAAAALRDASYYSYLSGREWRSFTDKLNVVEAEYSKLDAARSVQRRLVLNAKYPEAGEATSSLLAKVRDAEKRFAAMTGEAKKATADAVVPAKIAVKHKYGTIPSIASGTLPVNLSRLRGRLFETIRRIGSNIFSSTPFPPCYAEDPGVQKNMHGIQRDHKFLYTGSARIITGRGTLNPSNGTVKEGKVVPYPEESLSWQMQGIFRAWAWKGKDQFRIGTADETGLGLNYFGKPAEEDLQKHLKAYYRNDIAAMNAHCGTSYKSFEEVKVPVKQPETPAQHAVWEHFRQLREKLLENFYSRFYKLVKKYNRDIDVFQLPSTGGITLPVYGINYYNVTKYQDVSGIDGTCCSTDEEWIFLDLTTKRYLTSEWGCLYQTTPRHKVYGQLFRELSGGALGFEQHVWSFGDEGINYADVLDIPTIYGAVLHRALIDARKLDHLILDGERTVPEVGILFSQTSRVHDQGWGWAGGSTMSAHIITVSTYYKYFLEFGRSARVIAEEAVLDGKLPPVKILIVPQAEFLSEALQKKLMEYAAKGGKLVIEGRSGRYDEFGRKSDYLFRQACVIPSFTSAREVVMEKSRIGLQKKDAVYSPSGKGKVLASYSAKEPSVLTTPVGKGSVTFVGFGAGLYKYNAFSPVMERVLRSLGFSERFRISAGGLILREWKHDTGTYLLISSMKGADSNKWGMEETEIRVRGNVAVEDYLFGKKVKSTYRDGYTVFRTLVSDGMRVFRIASGKIAEMESVKGSPVFKLESSSGAKDDIRKIVLPWKGRLYASTPLKAGNTVFSAAILGSGSNHKIGNAFLTVTVGNEVQRKRIETGRTVFFRMSTKNYKVKCVENFFMYPFYAVLEISEVNDVPASKKAAVSKKKDLVTLANDLLSLSFDSGRGAVMTSFLPLAEKEEVVFNKRAWAMTGGMPGPFINSRFDVKTSHAAGSAVAEFYLKSPVANKFFTQKVTLAPSAAAVNIDLTASHTGNRDEKIALRTHPELKVGGSADNADLFVFSSEKGAVRTTAFRGQSKGYWVRGVGTWSAVVDTREKVALIRQAAPGQIELFYVWEAGDFYTMEIFATPKKVAKGQPVLLNLRLLYLHGLTGVDAVSGMNAAHLVIPGIMDQRVPFAPVLEFATAENTLSEATVSAVLCKDGKEIVKFPAVKRKIAFDLPAAISLTGGKTVLADGKYVMQVKVISPNGNLSFDKEVEFAGSRIADLEKKCSLLTRKLSSMENKLSADKKFDLRVKLGDLKRALADRDFALAQKLAAEMKKDF